MTDTIAQRVARGAALLDEVRPGWRAEVDATSLDLSSPGRCILGQLYGLCSQGVRAIGLNWHNGTSVPDHGFDRVEENQEYGPLTEAWCAEVAR